MKRLVSLLLVSSLVPLALGGEDDWLRPLGRPPKASPRRISGGESFPPLPLPATPLRRTERKRQPRPPTLVGKVVWGENAMFTYENGMTAKVSDWNQCPADVQQLLAKSGRWFNLPYATRALPLSEFDGDPQKLPMLLFSGSRSIRIDDKQIPRLRAYVMDGGMVVFDSIAGSPFFYASAKRLVSDMFPRLKLRQVPPDHPIYHMLYDVNTVSYPKNRDSDKPVFEALYVGSRIGVLVSPFGLGCGWDDHEVPLIEEAVYYDVESSNKIGLNIIAYAVGYAQVGREEAKPELFGTLDEQRPTDEFVFAQIRHDGAWNVHPGSAAALLRRLRQNTSLRVCLKRVPVTPGKDDLSPFAFLYLSGLDKFQLDDAGISALRRFLDGAGTLVLDNGLGLPSFDAVARREIKRLLPNAELARVPITHPVYRTVFDIKECRYAPAVVSTQPDLNVPVLEGIAVGGDLKVIYSPYDMGAAWLGCEYPLARAYEPHSGMQLGVNIVMYAMTH